MKIVLKVISFLFGLALIGAVIWLGYLTANNQSPTLVALFGIAAALAAPAGLALIGYVFSSNDHEIISRLSKVPEIEKLITEAQSQEEKIRLLEKQKQQLAEIIQFEARRQSLINRKETNEREAVRLLEELKAIETELFKLNITIEENEEIAEVLHSLHERISARQRNAFVFSFGNTSFSLDYDILRRLPMGDILFIALKINKALVDLIEAKLRPLIEKWNRNKEQK